MNKIVIAAISLVLLAALFYGLNRPTTLQLVVVNNSPRAVDSFVLTGSGITAANGQSVPAIPAGGVVEQQVDLQPVGRLRFVAKQGLNRASGILVKRVERWQLYQIIITVDGNNRYQIEQQ
ncbi:hypothetical protein SIN8267_00187 [Sinobacterium norvegicum]|uniref:Uncharacterized protein n=1 Tax=Sinobacterium norvegicum TaxID=1641715 RepID=A0ABM9AAU3_9GAMM|nr:hypothetical protein [Sinobacterium norvegicum]CAH0990104.1 hypothetical protein SIN8267_00187 [Sinobacterium norvegicum]